MNKEYTISPYESRDLDGNLLLPQIQATAPRFVGGHQSMQGHLCNAGMNSRKGRFTNKVCSTREIMILVS